MAVYPYTAPRALDGIGVLVTRPAHQAGALIQMIEAAGGHARHVPMVEIVALSDPGPLTALIDRLEHFDFAVFISPNAVQHGVVLIQARRAWPANVKIAGVGPGTAKALAEFGHNDVLTPLTCFSSEGLLEREEFQQVAGKRIVIFRGHGGRELLATVLRERGARVEYAECYHRRPAAIDADALRRLWTERALHIVTAASPDALRHLVAAMGDAGRASLLATPLVVVSSRMAAIARELGFSAAVLTARDAGDTAVVEALEAWRRSRISL
jgi:uroporphyrinogen-III synthase